MFMMEEKSIFENILNNVSKDVMSEYRRMSLLSKIDFLTNIQKRRLGEEVCVSSKCLYKNSTNLCALCNTLFSYEPLDNLKIQDEIERLKQIKSEREWVGY